MNNKKNDSKRHSKSPKNEGHSDKKFKIVLKARIALSEKQRQDILDIINDGIKYNANIVSIKVHIMMKTGIYTPVSIIKTAPDTIEVIV